MPNNLNSRKLGFALVLVALLSATSLCSTFTVTKVADTNDGVCDSDCSLREAIAGSNQASSNDIIQFDAVIFSTPKTIALNGSEIDITNGSGDLIINGPGASNLTISGNNASRVFVFDTVATITLNDLTIANGHTIDNNDGAGIYNHANAIFNNVTFVNNASSSEGGAIYNNTSGDLTITGCTFSNNTAGVEGGAIDSDTFTDRIPVVLISSSSFVGNSSISRGGGAISGSYTLTVTNSTFSNNSAPFAGAVVGGSFSNVTFTGNISNNGTNQAGFGGAIYGPKSVTSCNFTNNSAATAGGAIYFPDSGPVALTITDSTFTMNTAAVDGGAIYSFRTNLIVNHSLFSNNTASRNGGAIYNSNISSQTVTLNSSIVRNNQAARDGGGIYNDFASGLALNSTLVSANSATSTGGEGGGGIYAAIGTVSLTNSTLSGNTTSQRGGGLFNRGTTTITSSTISGNSAAVAGGGINNFSTSTVNARNTLVGDNASTSGTGPDFAGTLQSQGYNLIESTSGTVITGISTGNVLNRDPQLVPLRDNGGSTMTVGLQPLSPAIDAGDPNNFPATDQRGVARAQDGDLNGSSAPDIGSYESKLILFTVTKVADTNDGTCDSDCSLREAVAAANLSTSPDNAVVLASALLNQPQTIVLTNSDIKISGPGTLLIGGPGSDVLTISGNHNSRVLTFLTGSIAGISGVTITAGNGVSTVFPDWGGGVLTRESFLTLEHCVISENSTSMDAGSGGGIYNFGGTLRLRSTTVSGSLGWNGGAVVNTSFGGILEVTNSIISNNWAGMGSGIYNQGAATIINSTISNNTSQGGCTGILGGQSLVVVNSLIKGNHATGISNGGGVCAGESGSISGSRIENNSAGSGGGLVMGDSFALINSTVANNVASSRGGGIMTGQGNGLTTIINSNISGNRASDLGGGIQCSMPMKVTNSTISHNSSAGNFGFGGGGVFVELPSGGSVDFVNSTIAFNDARIGGGVHNNSGTVTAKNSIVARNFSSGTGSDFQGILSSLGYNLVQDTNGLTITGTTTGNILGLDPLLDPVVRMNGGPTATHALRKYSPAIDKGAATTPATTTDQRGLTRPVDILNISNAPGGNASDIGAFEEQLTDVVVPAVPFDFDGDGKTDIGITRPNGGVTEWWLSRSSDSNVFATVFGVTVDIPTPGDFTGDGKTDIAVFRPSNGNWFILRSEDFTFLAFPFGANGDIPMPADFDADGKADPAVFRPSSSTWFISRSSDNQTTIAQFGAAGDQPVAADYDGDGKADIAIFRQNGGNKEWWVQRSTLGLFATVFGVTGDKAVQGDYTGDGKADIAVWRPSNGNWFILRSEDFSFLAFPWGANGDSPAPGDYDGDGKFDAAVFRASSATWFVNRTGGAGPLITGFGAATDSPVPGSFVR